MSTDPHRGWLAPNGDYHGLSDFSSPGPTSHAGWVERNTLIHGEDKNVHSHDSMENLVQKGWIMKRGKYDGTKEVPGHILFRANDEDPSVVGRIRAHMKKHHLSEKVFGLQGIEYEHEGIYNVNESAESSSERGWISHTDEFHPMYGFEIHRDWVNRNHDLVPASHMSSPVTRSPIGGMLQNGWIMKRGRYPLEDPAFKSGHHPVTFTTADANNPETLNRLRAHMKKHHPGESHFAVNSHRRDTYAVPVNESRADRLIRLVLEGQLRTLKPALLESTRAVFGFIKPDGSTEEAPFTGQREFEDSETHDTMAYDMGFTNPRREHPSCIAHAIMNHHVRFIRTPNALEIELHHGSDKARENAVRYIAKHHRPGKEIGVEFYGARSGGNLITRKKENALAFLQSGPHKSDTEKARRFDYGGD